MLNERKHSISYIVALKVLSVMNAVLKTLMLITSSECCSLLVIFFFSTFSANNINCPTASAYCGNPDCCVRSEYATQDKISFGVFLAREMSTGLVRQGPRRECLFILFSLSSDPCHMLSSLMLCGAWRPLKEKARRTVPMLLKITDLVLKSRNSGILNKKNPI